MSRSYRHSCISGHGGGSEKQDKRIYNRCLRSRIRQLLRVGDLDFDAVVLPEVRDVSDPWGMNKDGKSYSRWLALHARTLANVTRLRDGRCRRMLCLTAATIEVAEAEFLRRRLRWSFFAPSENHFEEAIDAVRGIRK